MLISEKLAQSLSWPVPQGSAVVRTESGVKLQEPAGVYAVSLPATAKAPLENSQALSAPKLLVIGAAVALMILLSREGKK